MGGRSRQPTTRLCLACCLVLFAVVSGAATPDYSPDVPNWREIQVPPEGRDPERVVWDFAANYSRLSWHVYLDNGKPYAKLIEKPNDDFSDREPFDAEADKFRGASHFEEVDDGWLVGFNHGEFGAALYWFDRDGTHHYKISNHQVVAFFALPDGIYAAEGLAHLGISCGSVIRIMRPRPAARWGASRVVRLPYAPRTVAVRQNGTVLMVLSDSLVSVSPDHRVSTLISDAPWDGLYPASSILLPDESHLFVGMRQFVAEIDLATHRLRLLVPSREFLNKLPDEMERRIRKQYPNGTQDWHQPVGTCEEMERAAIRNAR
jgi:hypothetical protein